LGIFTIYSKFFSLDYSVIFSLAPLRASDTISIFGQVYNSFDFITFFLFIGAVGKSAQVGLHT